MQPSLITPERPALVLAPMEGVADSPMRALLTERGGFSFCVSEFLRITKAVPPSWIYHEHVPELKTYGRTPSGTPVQVQLLGGDEETLALSAVRACEQGALAIDLNFGCPAPTVNRHDGGASLLRYPNRIRGLIYAVKRAIPPGIPVSAKLRLGWESMEDIFVNAEQAALGGASWLTIHARTRMQGYAPPAHWKYIGEVKKRLSIPIIANGDIWTREDFLRCQEETDCRHFMIGRGALADPSLPYEIARQLGIAIPRDSDHYPFGVDQKDWRPILLRFVELSAPVSREPHYTVRRIKQWLKHAHLRRPLPWFDRIKTVTTLEEFFAILA
jgi:tRNA-dihydrouridine synthase C